MTPLTDILLLVEDNPDDAALTLRAFRQARLLNPVVVVQDGVEALDFLFARGAYSERTGQPLPKLILLDLKLPRLDGIEVLRAIRADTGTRLIPVLMLTSSTLEQDLLACYTVGATSYLVKPVDFSAFVEMAKVLTLYWLTMNRSPPAQMQTQVQT